MRCVIVNYEVVLKKKMDSFVTGCCLPRSAWAQVIVQNDQNMIYLRWFFLFVFFKYEDNMQYC